MEKILCYTAGRAHGNPGPSAIGIYICDAAGIMITEVAQSIGNSTDTFAQYNAVMVGLQTLQSLYGVATHTTQFELCLDSELVKKQLNAESQINDPGLVPMFIEIHNVRVASFPNLVLTLVTEAYNAEADRLVAEVFGGK